MLIRRYRAEDAAALRELHGKQGFAYELPDIEHPLFLSKLVLEDGQGRPVMAVLARLTCELYLLADPQAGTPRERLEGFLALHGMTEHDLARKGLEDGTCWVPPKIEKAFGRRLARLGWAKDPWAAYSRRIST